MEAALLQGLNNNDDLTEDNGREKARKRLQMKRLRDSHRASSARQKQKIAEKERDRKLLEAERLLARTHHAGEIDVVRVPSPYRGRSATPTSMSIRSLDLATSGGAPTRSGGGAVSIPTSGGLSATLEMSLMTVREEMAAWQAKIDEKEKSVALALKENASLRAEVEFLRKRQLGIDEEIWDIVAPHKKARMYDSVVADAKSASDRRRLVRATEEVDNERKRHDKLVSLSGEYRSMLNRYTKERLVFERDREALEAEVLRLQHDIYDRTNEKKELIKWEKAHQENMEKIEKKWSHQIDQELEAISRDGNKEVAAFVAEAKAAQLAKLKREAENEKVTLAQNLDAQLKSALQLTGQIDRLKKERARLLAQLNLTEVPASLGGSKGGGPSAREPASTGTGAGAGTASGTGGGGGGGGGGTHASSESGSKGRSPAVTTVGVPSKAPTTAPPTSGSSSNSNSNNAKGSGGSASTAQEETRGPPLVEGANQRGGAGQPPSSSSRKGGATTSGNSDVAASTSNNEDKDEEKKVNESKKAKVARKDGTEEKKDKENEEEGKGKVKRSAATGARASGDEDDGVAPAGGGGAVKPATQGGSEVSSERVGNKGGKESSDRETQAAALPSSPQTTGATSSDGKKTKDRKETATSKETKETK